MKRLFARCIALMLPLLFAGYASAQDSAARMTATNARAGSSAAAIAPIARQKLFGNFPVATRSDDARKLVETAIDQYENVLLDVSVANARKAAQKDPHFALAYAVWSFAARRNQPNAEALRRAQALAAHAAPGEQLLVNWMVDVQQGDMIPAISTMNDLLARYPNDKHVLYLTSEWLYFQQDYDRARKMMEKMLRIDPDFAPALNMLGYAYVETGTPDPAKAIASLKHYAAVQPHQPNPEDSLGEVLRYAGDDQGSLEHYAAALKIVPTFITSQIGLGDTSALMGNFAQARAEYDKALGMAANSRDRFHIQYQKALVCFWEGQPEQGRQALDALLAEAREKKDPYAQFEIGLGLAQLGAESDSQLNQLRNLEVSLERPLATMTEDDRNISIASVRREEARIAALGGHLDAARGDVARLERSAKMTRDLLIKDNYESARGYVSFAEGNFSDAADGLASDPHSPLALQRLALAQDKLGDSAAADAVRTRLKYLRAPTAEWYLVTHSPASTSAMR